MKIVNKLKLNKHFILKVSLLMFSSLSIAAPTFANGLQKIGDSVKNGMLSIISAVLLCVGAYFLFTRDWVKMISFVAIAILVAVFSDWQTVKDIGKSIYDFVNG